MPIHANGEADRGIGDGRCRAIGIVQMPATLGRWVAIGAPCQNGGPIGFNGLHIHAKFAHQFNRKPPLLRDSREIAWVDVDDGFAIIACFPQRDAGTFHRCFTTRGGREFHHAWQAARKHGVAFLPVTLQRHRRHEIRLHNHITNGAAHPHIIEGRMQMIEAEKTKKPVRIINLGLRIAVPFQHRHQIGQRVFDPVNFTGAECGRRRAAIRDPDHLQPVEMHALAA